MWEDRERARTLICQEFCGGVICVTDLEEYSCLFPSLLTFLVYHSLSNQGFSEYFVVCWKIRPEGLNIVVQSRVI